jgi:hypothetical protein
MAAEAENKELLLVGLQETGKTSFLALFYLTLIHGEGLLGLASFQNDREHLNRISKRLMECETAVHTQVAEKGSLLLSLEVKKTEEPVGLSIPDLSGETWEEAVEQRLWTMSVDRQVRQGDAVLLFTSADQFDAGLTKGDADYGVKEFGVEVPASKPQRSNPEAKQVRMKGKPPTQVQLVDLLQLTVEQRGTRPSRACIMISAWDTEATGITPREYVTKNLPLLNQYLEANSAWLSVRIFGVSAQGGSFKDPDERKRLAGEDPQDRAFLVADDGEKIPFGTPIEWALGLDEDS